MVKFSENFPDTSQDYSGSKNEDHTPYQKDNSNRLQLLLQREDYLTTNGTANNIGGVNFSGLNTSAPDLVTPG